MNSIYSDLRWLPRAPEDFSARLKHWVNEPSGSELQALAHHSLSLNQLTKMASAIDKTRRSGQPLNTLSPFKLAILSNSTTDLIVPALIATAARHGILLEVIQPSYDQVVQEAVTPDSKVNSSRCDAVLFAIDYRSLPLKQCPGNREVEEDSCEGALQYLRMLRNGIKAYSNAVCIFQTFAPPAERVFGNIDCLLPGTVHRQIQRVNEALAQSTLESGDVLVDVAGLAETVGLADWHSPQLWNLAKLAFSDDCIALYADVVMRTVAAIRGKSKKVLVLDLDNTVWGGVIGDDGLEGIKVAQGDARGEAHLALQRMALDLRQRGIVLAVSSKNNDDTAREPFEKHPEMLLRMEHIAVFQANWEDKATNIKAISRELSLGLDSMVFVDDNPAERELVRQFIPQVAVPELPEDPAEYVRTIAAAGYFEAINFTSEDLQRAAFYQESAKRAKLQESSGGIDAYLASLDMVLTLQPFDAPGRARIVQLINKSNQFNLTTRRYTDPEIMELEMDPTVFTLQVRLADTFGDNGMISVIICRPTEPAVWTVDTWLMSCRVLGRKVEYMVLNQIVASARKAGITKLLGVYLPTEKNKLVVDHYQKLGFTRSGGDASGMSVWELDLANYVLHTPAMKIISELPSDIPQEQLQ